MSVDISNLNGLLKEVYSSDKVENLQNEEAVTWNKLKKNPTPLGGRGYTFSVTVQGNQAGMGAQNELEALRTAGNQVPQRGTINPKIVTHTCQLSGLSLEMANSTDEAFMENLTYQMDNGILDTKKELNQQLFRDGLGRIAQVNGAVSGSASVVFDNGVPTHFRVGMKLDAINGSSVKQIDNITVSSIDISTNTITLASTQSCDDDSWLYRAGVGDNAPTDGKEISGLKLLTDTGAISATYEGISRSTYPIWSGITIDGGSASVSNDLLERVVSRVLIAGGRKVNKVVSNTSQFRKYLSVVTALKEFRPGDKMDSGYSQPVPTWNGMEWIVDTDCGFDEIYFLNTNLVERYDTYPLAFDETDGNILKWNNGSDSFIAYAKYYGNVGTRVPNANARLHTLATPTY